MGSGSIWDHALKAMGFIQMFAIDLKVTCIKRSRWPDPGVKMADSDVALFPRYWFLKLPGCGTMADAFQDAFQDGGCFPVWIPGQKIFTDWECQKTPTNQISSSKHVWFLRNKIPKICLSFVWDILFKPVPLQMIGEFLGFYFSRTRNVWKMKFGLWGSFGIPNQ